MQICVTSATMIFVEEAINHTLTVDSTNNFEYMCTSVYCMIVKNISLPGG